MEKKYQEKIKRVIDLSLSSAGLIVLAPVFVSVSCGVAVSMGWPVFYRQKRLGLHGAEFEIIKFRTMSNGKDNMGNLLPDKFRLTKLGHFLRKTSLDEIPQLLNVLRGELSLVGPRPLLVHYRERYSERQWRRHEVMPGVTGWAQVNGRNAISWAQRFELDVWYVDNWDLMLDLKILAMTFGRVIRRADISSDGHATMEEFMGN